MCSNKTKILSFLFERHFQRMAKINSQQEKPIAKNSSRETQKSANPQN